MRNLPNKSTLKALRPWYLVVAPFRITTKAKRPILAAAAFFLLFLPQKLHANDISRGIWYDIAGMDRNILERQIITFKNYGVERVHIVVSSYIKDMGIYKECDKRIRQTERDPNQVTDRQVEIDIKKCAAKMYIFGFDNWLRKKGRVPLGLLVKKLHNEGIDVILTIWPEPTKNYIKSLTILTNFVKRNPVYAVELEDETSNWTNDYTVGFANKNAAAVELIKKLRAELPKHVKIGATTNPRDFQKDKFLGDALMEHADFIAFQSYHDVCPRGRCNERLITGNYAPGVMQERAIRTLREVGLGQKALILGLPAYQQDVPRGHGEINMYMAAKKVICADAKLDEDSPIIGSSYWSYANITAARKNGYHYASNFLAKCKVESMARRCGNVEGGNGENLIVEVAKSCPGIEQDEQKFEFGVSTQKGY